MTDLERAAYSDLFGENGQGGAARDALATLDYLINAWEDMQEIDATNMRHVYKSAELLRAAVGAADRVGGAEIKPGPWITAPARGPYYCGTLTVAGFTILCKRPDGSASRIVAHARDPRDARAIVIALNGSL